MPRAPAASAIARIMLRHMVPNVMAPFLILLTDVLLRLRKEGEISRNFFLNKQL